MAAHVKDVLHHFSFAHPQTPTGPQPWAEPISPALAAFATGIRPTFDLAELHPNEADALRGYAALRSDLSAALADDAHPAGEAVRAAFAAADARAAAAPAPTPATDQADQAAAAAAPGIAAAKAEIDRLLKDPQFTKAYYDKRQPGHDEAVAEMGRLHQALIVPSAAQPPGPPIAATDLAGLQERIATLNGQLRQYELSGPDRAALSEELAHLSAQLPPGVRPAMPADTRDASAGRRPVEVVVPAGRGLTPRSIELSNQLKSGNLRGTSRAAILNQLQAALNEGQAEADTAAAAAAP